MTRSLKTKNSFVRITKHGMESLEERVKREVLLREVQAAWEIGKLLTDDEARIILLKGFDKAQYWQREYRKYNGHVYVFQILPRGLKLLITVI